MRYVVSCTILLEPNIVHINTMKSLVQKKIGFHGALGLYIDFNHYAVLISKEIWANDASASQAAPKSCS